MFVRSVTASGLKIQGFMTRIHARIVRVTVSSEKKTTRILSLVWVVSVEDIPNKDNSLIVVARNIL